jgi:hypothetical protein
VRRLADGGAPRAEHDGRRRAGAGHCESIEREREGEGARERENKQEGEREREREGEGERGREGERQGGREGERDKEGVRNGRG